MAQHVGIRDRLLGQLLPGGRNRIGRHDGVIFVVRATVSRAISMDTALTFTPVTVHDWPHGILVEPFQTACQYVSALYGPVIRRHNRWTAHTRTCYNRGGEPVAVGVRRHGW